MMNDVSSVCIAYILLVFGVCVSLYNPLLTPLVLALDTQTSTTTIDTTVATTTASQALGYTIETIDSSSESSAKDFVVGPGKTELTINKGESKTVEIVVTNRTGQKRQFNFEIEDASGSDNPQTPIVLLGEDEGPYTLREYITLPTYHIDLKNNERARIPVIINIPIDAEAGGKYGSILVATISKDTLQTASGDTLPSSTIISRLGTLFFITVPGDTHTEGFLQSISTLPAFTVHTKGTIGFQLLFENKGDLHLNPYGEIRIRNILGEEVGFLTLDPWFAMPKSLRSREVVWERQLLIGRYTATAYINRGYNDTIDTASVTFWVLPWKILVVTFLALALCIYVVGFIVRNFEFKRKQPTS